MSNYIEMWNLFFLQTTIWLIFLWQESDHSLQMQLWLHLCGSVQDHHGPLAAIDLLVSLRQMEVEKSHGSDSLTGWQIHCMLFKKNLDVLKEGANEPVYDVEHIFVVRMKTQDSCGPFSLKSLLGIGSSVFQSVKRSMSTIWSFTLPWPQNWGMNHLSSTSTHSAHFWSIGSRLPAARRVYTPH